MNALNIENDSMRINVHGEREIMKVAKSGHMLNTIQNNKNSLYVELRVQPNQEHTTTNMDS